MQGSLQCLLHASIQLSGTWILYGIFVSSENTASSVKFIFIGLHCPLLFKPSCWVLLQDVTMCRCNTHCRVSSVVCKTELSSDNTLFFIALKVHKVWTKWHTVASYRKECCPCLCYESVWGRRGIAALIRNLGSMAAVPLGKNFGTHWIGGWVGLRVSLDIFEKRRVSCSARIQSLDCSACSLVIILITLWRLPW